MNTSPDRHIKADVSYELVRDVCSKSELYLRTLASGCHTNAAVHRHPHYMHEHARCSSHRYTQVPGGSCLGSHVVRRHQGRTSLGPGSGTAPSDPYLGPIRTTIHFPHYATANYAARTTFTVTVVQLGSMCGYAWATGIWVVSTRRRLLREESEWYVQRAGTTSRGPSVAELSADTFHASSSLTANRSTLEVHRHSRLPLCCAQHRESIR